MAAGLIQSSMEDTEEKDFQGTGVATAKTTTYDPSLRTVDQAKETVAGQIDSVISKDSPLLQRARARSAQTANSRGLLNSTMAAQAGEAAVIDAALPIASQDANIYGTASRDNQLADNTARQFGASESNVNARVNADAMNQTGRMKLGSELEKSLIGTREGAESRLSAQAAAQQQAQTMLQAEMQKGLITTQEQADARLRELTAQLESQLQSERISGETQLTQMRGELEQQLQTLRGGQAENLANIEANYRNLIQANASATTFYTQQVTNMAAILADVNTSPEQKQQAVDKMTQFLESGLTIIGSIADIDIAGLLDFSEQGG